ncbi:MAG: DUF2971 domain-containing protein [Bacteroidales bacterium]|nr:DUF2971 domain-containing protein [Bacteroidales bacterium]
MKSLIIVILDSIRKCKLRKYEFEIESYINNYQQINKTNAEKAKRSFSEEWLRLCPYLGRANRFNEDGASKLGQALIKYSAAIEQLPCKESEVIHLKELIDTYDRDKDCRYKISIKEALYFNLGLCWHKLGTRYEDDALLAFKKSLFFLLEQSNHKSYAGLSAYGFRKCNEFLYKSLINEQLNISSPSEFNDPFDCPILVLLNMYDDEINKLILKAYNDSLKIACFSRKIKLLPEISEQGEPKTNEDGNPIYLHKQGCDKDEYLNELMWAHYADFHKGVCIKYHFNAKMTKMITSSNRIISYFKDVKYSENDMSKYSNKDSISVEDSFFLKSKNWEYENELRYLYFDIDGTGKHKQIDIPNCIEAVYFGVKCAQSDKDTIRKILKDQKLITYDLQENMIEKGIEFYQMEMDMNQFGQLKAVKL